VQGVPEALPTHPLQANTVSKNSGAQGVHTPATKFTDKPRVKGRTSYDASIWVREVGVKKCAEEGEEGGKVGGKKALWTLFS